MPKSDPEWSPMADPKSMKNHWKSILVPSECILAPNGHQNNEKVVSQNPECLKNGPPRPQKINKPVKPNEWNLLEKTYASSEFSSDFNPASLSNPSSLQITNQLVAEGAGGRGEALDIYSPNRFICRGSKGVGLLLPMTPVVFRRSCRQAFCIVIYNIWWHLTSKTLREIEK